MMITIGVYFAYSLVFPFLNTRKKTFGYLLIFPLLFAIATSALNVDLINYLKSGFIIANSFVDAMFLEIGDNSQFLWMAVTIIFLYAWVFLINPRKFLNNKKFLLMYLITAIFIFAMYKYGVVRYGRNMTTFFAYVPPAIGFLYLYSPNWNKTLIAKLFIVSLILSFSVFARSYKIDMLTESIKGLRTYALEFVGIDNRALQESDLEEVQLPEHILEIIGQKSVDVFPWEISMIYKNKLTYNPRPVIQSHMAYDEYLDNKNFNKLTSNNAPEYLLFSLGTIDWRHPFFDESKTKRAILTNYKVLGKFDNYLIMGNRINPVRQVETTSEHESAKLGDFIEIEFTDQLIYLNTDIEYSLMGSIARLLFQPPRLKMTIQFYDGEERTFNAIKSIITSDVLINKFVDSINSAQYFFEYGGRLSKPVKRVKFYTDDTWGFKPEFTYKLKTVMFDHNKFNKPEILFIPLANEITLLGLEQDKRSQDLFIDLHWSCKPSLETSNKAYYVNIHLENNGSIVSIDESKILLCPHESEEIITTSHWILLDANIIPSLYHLIVNLLEDNQGQLIPTGSTTIENFIMLD
ncbi:hypothetical protein ACFLV7_08655 [Chloroflexota bacterium]